MSLNKNNLPDFSDVEDDPNFFEIISDIATTAIRNAIAEAKALGLSRVYIHNNQLIEEDKDGNKTVLMTGRPNGGDFYVYYLPFTVLRPKYKW